MSETTKNANEFSIILEGLARDGVIGQLSSACDEGRVGAGVPCSQGTVFQGGTKNDTGVEMDCRCELGYVFIVSNAVSTPGLLPPCAGAGCWGHSQM